MGEAAELEEHKPAQQSHIVVLSALVLANFFLFPIDEIVLNALVVREESSTVRRRGEAWLDAVGEKFKAAACESVSH